MNLNSKYLTPGERKLVDWQYNLHGGFYTALWKAISCADSMNTARLMLAFPEEVAAYQAFSFMKGYWENVKLRGNLLPIGSKLVATEGHNPNDERFAVGFKPTENGFVMERDDGGTMQKWAWTPESEALVGHYVRTE